MRFSVNISTLFTELAFVDRIAAAASAGFGAIECWWPTGEDLDRVAEAVSGSGLEVALLNFDAGDMAAGDRGLLSDLEREDRFRANVPVALELAGQLGCRRLNALVGTERPGQDPAEQLRLAAANVTWAAEQAAQRSAEILIEPINRLENGPYLLSRVNEALAFIAEVQQPNVRLLYDAYHVQRTEGNLTATLRGCIRQVAHVQIADSPDRREPGTGEINYCFVLNVLRELGYDGFVGLEYRPDGVTDKSLRWIPVECRSAEVEPERLFAVREASR